MLNFSFYLGEDTKVGSYLSERKETELWLPMSLVSVLIAELGRKNTLYLSYLCIFLPVWFSNFSPRISWKFYISDCLPSQQQSLDFTSHFAAFRMEAEFSTYTVHFAVTLKSNVCKGSDKSAWPLKRFPELTELGQKGWVHSPWHQMAIPHGNSRSPKLWPCESLGDHVLPVTLKYRHVFLLGFNTDIHVPIKWYDRRQRGQSVPIAIRVSVGIQSITPQVFKGLKLRPSSGNRTQENSRCIKIVLTNIQTY